MSSITFDDLNSLIYMTPLSEEPTRYQMIRYSTWRIYFFQQLQSLRQEQMNTLKNQCWIDKYPQLTSTNQERQYYLSLLNELKNEKQKRQDMISHFICRILYCYDNANHAKFIEMEKSIFKIKLEKSLTKDLKYRKRQMDILKKILSFFLQKKFEDFNVPIQDWNTFSSKMAHNKQEIPQQFALVPIQYGENGMRKRYCFVRRGNVYMNISCATDLVVSLYGIFLKSKLQKMRGPIIDMVNNDVENQISTFVRKTVQTLNTTSFDQTVINNQFKLNLKNVDSLWKKFYPPCMLNLTQKLKQNNHLKHQGRRQLWLYLKGCGMDAHDNKQYFRKHFMAKVSGSDLKNHMYNIEHAYGLVGKKQAERPKNCRNIITGPAPKKDQHHGCPFAHWRKQQLGEFLRKNYNISEASLQEVFKQKQQNHFQVACGRLFQGVIKSEGTQLIPAQITNILGKSPHQYFQAGMQMININNNKGRKVEKQPFSQKKSIQF